MNELLAEIQSLTIGDEWKIGTEYLLDFLSLTREEYARFVYSQRRKILDSLEVRDYYTHENVNEMIFILNAFGKHAEAEEFFKAGYCLPADKELLLQEIFISATLSRIQNHNPDRDLLETILAGCSDYRDAFDTYLMSEFPLNDLILNTVHIFLKRTGMEDHHLSRKILQNTLRGFIQNKTVRINDLYQSGWKYLRAYCIREGLLHGGHAEESTGKAAALPDEIRKALRELELSETEIPSQETVRKNFRRLLKKFHPDKNPEGTEKTRSLNASYTLLLSFCSERTSS